MPDYTRTPYWLIARSAPIAMASVHKCASTSLRSLDIFIDFRTHEAALTTPTRVAWLRHPIARLASAFQGFLRRTAVENYRWQIEDRHLRSWPAFVDHTFEHLNDHWNPQIPQLTFEGQYMPTHTERFENLTSRYSHYLPGPLPHLNQSQEVGIIHPYRVRDLEEKYADDLELWSSI